MEEREKERSEHKLVFLLRRLYFSRLLAFLSMISSKASGFDCDSVNGLWNKQNPKQEEEKDEEEEEEERQFKYVCETGFTQSFKKKLFDMSTNLW